MNIKQKKESFYEESARLFKLLSSPLRLKLINYISFAPRTVDDCSRKFDQSVQNISLHLIALSKAGVLEVEKIKNFRYYSLSENKIVQLVSQVLDADSRSLLDSQFVWEGESSDLLNIMKKKKALVVDLRDDEERSYIPFRDSIHYNGKLSDLEDFLKSIKEKKPLMFICKGRWCERLAQAVETSSRLGHQVKGLCLTANDLRGLNSHFN